MATQHSNFKGFTGDLVVKNLPANAANAGLVPKPGRSSGGGNGNPFQYSCQGKFHGQRSLVDYSPSSHKELNMTDNT